MKYYSTEDKQVALPDKPVLTEKQMLVPACFALVILLFFFSFCRFRVVADGNAFSSGAGFISGIKLVTGVAVFSPPEMRKGDGFANNLFNINTTRFNGLQKASFNIWAILALAAAIGGILVFFKSGHREALIGMAATGFVSLVILQLGIKSKYENSLDAGLFTIRTQVLFQFAYWASLLAFAAAALVSYWYAVQKNDRKIIDAKLTPTPLHVSIITQQADAEDKI